MAALLQTWLHTPDLGRKQAMLKEHPELLGPEVDNLLIRTDDVRTRIKLEKFRRFFHCCREMGIDAAFAQLRPDEESPDWIVCTSLLKALAAGSVEEVEQAIRQDPRIVDRPIREYCRNALLAKELGIPVEQIQSRLAMLELCEQNGLDMMMHAVRAQVPAEQPAAANTPAPASAPTPNVSEMFNNVIAKFERGGADAEVAAEAAALMLRLPWIPRTSCVLMAMLASFRAGNIAGARKWAVRLNQVARGADLPGVPSKAIADGMAVMEGRNHDSIAETLEAMCQKAGAAPLEQESIKSLLTQYREREHKLKPTSRAASAP